MVNIRFDNKAVDVRTLETYPSRFHVGDYIQGPDGTMLKIVTVQKDVPYFEDLSKKKTVVVLVNESGSLIPINGMFGKHRIYRERH
jgi:hypothetical protein